MYIPKNFGVSTFLMLVLIQTALCVPVENNNNQLSNRKDAKPAETHTELVERLKNLIQHEMNEAKNKLENIVTQLTSPEFSKKLKEVMEQISPEKVSETCNKLIDELMNTAIHEMANAKAKLDEFVDHINSSETHKKVKELMSEFSDGELAKKYKKMTQQVRQEIERELSVLRAKYDDFIAHVNTPQANQKLKDLMAEMTPKKIAESCKRMTERVTNIVKHELAGVNAKMQNLVKHINSPETQKKFKELMDELSREKLEALGKKIAEDVTKVVEHEVAAAKAKVEDFLAHVKPAKPNGNN